mmetsp:Transcript_15112/g.52355  ORF Transcript_15112/g.52355 Transcript_15112/m.52355 type:complete len:107 (-) Transcript_15112:155-475(-)
MHSPHLNMKRHICFKVTAAIVYVRCPGGGCGALEIREDVVRSGSSAGRADARGPRFPRINGVRPRPPRVAARLTEGERLPDAVAARRARGRRRLGRLDDFEASTRP